MVDSADRGSFSSFLNVDIDSEDDTTGYESTDVAAETAVPFALVASALGSDTLDDVICGIAVE